MPDFFVPFDNNPTSHDEETTTYTVPAGKYAKVTVNISISGSINLGSLTLTTARSTVLARTAHSFDVWMKAGDTLVMTDTSSSPIGATGSDNVQAAGSCVVTLDSGSGANNIADIRDTSFFDYQASGIGPLTLTTTTTSHLVAQEYNVIA